MKIEQELDLQKQRGIFWHEKVYVSENYLVGEIMENWDRSFVVDFLGRRYRNFKGRLDAIDFIKNKWQEFYKAIHGE